MSELIQIFKKQGGMKLIKQYWKSGVLFTGIVQLLFLGKNRTSLEILREITTLKIKKKIEKKYKREIEEFNRNYDDSLPHNNCNKIWVCWFQGLEDAPEIVKACYNSLKKNIRNREIVLITEENYKEYIEFPCFIQKKIDKGIIKGAEAADLLRLELLIKYGGTWIDATVFCSNDSVPEYMFDSNLFLFQCLKPGRDGHATTISNWFITASSNNKFLMFTREMLYSYWKKKDELVYYFTFHVFFQICIELYPEEWEKVIPSCNAVPHILLLRLFEQYDDKVWNAVCSASPFHKLTYKFSEEEMKRNDSYYEKIIKVTG